MKGLPYTYKCPKCGAKVSVLSNKYPPVCANKKQHSSESIKMELQNVQSNTNN